MTLGENIIGKRISAELQKQGKPQKWLAEQIGCTEASMTRYIDGTRIPKATTLGNIANALNVDANFLLGIEVKMTNADRIRNMSDKTLAGFFALIASCKACRFYKDCPVDNVACYENQLKWLQSEVEHDTRTSN
jgi:transcriptional regulator with XRE-family HTH domain